MEKKPVNFVVKNAEEAAKKLNEFVEKGGYEFDIGINEEYVYTVTKHSDGSKDESKERVYRIIGFTNMHDGKELEEYNAVKDELHAVKKERKEFDRTLNIMNKSAFAPISILLLCVAIVTLSLGILTLAKVLPLPAAQIPLAVTLVVIGALSLGGSIVLYIFRRKKKLALLARKDEILKMDSDLKQKEQEIDLRVPQWYKNAIWTSEGNTFKNFYQRFTLGK